MKKIIAIALVLAFALALSGCTGGSGETIVVYNSEDYIDLDIIKQFEAETGIKVVYNNFVTMEDLYIQIAKGGAQYDIVVPSDYIIERLIKEGRAEPLDKSKLPNLSNIYDWFSESDYDPGLEYSVPYMWGTVGVLYNYEMTGEDITSWAQLWDTKYVDQVVMMDSIRDTMGVTLKMLGYSMNDTSDEALSAAKEALIEQKRSGIVMAYGVDDIKDKLINNECAIGMAWSGDAVYAMSYNENLRYSVPEEGSNIWVDGIVIPSDAKNKEGAYKFIDFLMRPEIAAQNSEYIGYSTPNEAAMAIIDEELRDVEAFNPPQEIIDRCEWFHDIGENLSKVERVWTEITAQ